MSCLPIVSDRAATEGSKYFELGRQPHEFLIRNTCYVGYNMHAGYALYSRRYSLHQDYLKNGWLNVILRQVIEQ